MSAVSEFIARYGGLVWSIARRFTPTEADAEDAVQDIFVALWKACGKFDPQVASEKTFTTMIARRRLIDRNRRKKFDSDRSFDVDKLVSDGAAAPEKMELAEEAAIAADFLDRLPAEQSRAIKLAVYDGLSHSQIAELTGLSLGTIKTHIRRGIIKLRQSLGLHQPLEVKGGV